MVGCVLSQLKSSELYILSWGPFPQNVELYPIHNGQLKNF